MSSDDLRAQLKQEVISGNRDVVYRFRESFEHEIDEFVSSIFEASWSIHDFHERTGADQRSLNVSLYLHNARHNLVVSTHLLICGYEVPSGNLMRHFVESVSMALLVAEPSINVYEKLLDLTQRFPFHKAPDYVERYRARLGIDQNAWRDFKAARDFYGHSSHASLYAVAATLNFSTGAESTLGASFDSAKVEEYKRELVDRSRAADLLATISRGLDLKLHCPEWLDELTTPSGH